VVHADAGRLSSPTAARSRRYSSGLSVAHLSSSIKRRSRLSQPHGPKALGQRGVQRATERRDRDVGHLAFGEVKRGKGPAWLRVLGEAEQDVATTAEAG
jgi:hypothetical protein